MVITLKRRESAPSGVCVREKEREREGGREGERQTDRQTDRQSQISETGRK